MNPKKRSGGVGEWIDRNLIAPLFPRFAQKRIKSRQQTDYLTIKNELFEELSGRFLEGTNNDRLRGYRWNAPSISPDSGLDADITELQNRCRKLYRDNVIAHSAIEGRITHEVGAGILAQSAVYAGGEIDKDQARRIRIEIERLWNTWSSHGVDKSRLHSIFAMQRQVQRAFCCMGEAFILIGNSPVDGNSPTDLSLELIAAERVETPPSKTNDPTCVLGVQKNKEDEVQGYWVRTKHPGDDKQHEYEWIYYPRLNPKTGRPRLLHVFDPLFEGQTRGIPWLASVMNRLKDVDDFHEAELIAKQIEACFGLVVTRSEDASGSLHTRASSRSSETNSDGQRIEEIEPGLIEYLETGEDIKTISPDRPGMTFQPFIETTLRTVAGALNYPYELLAKNFFQTTFASGRLALLDGFAGFKMRQSVLLDMFLTPLWKTFCFELVVGDQLDQVESNMYYADPSRYDAVTWRSKPFGFIDPEKEVRAHATGKDKEILTLAEISAQKGTDWEETQSQMEIENQRTIERHLNNLAYQRELEKQLKLEPRPYVLGDVAEEPYIEKEEEE